MTEMGRKLPVKKRSCKSNPPPNYIQKEMAKWGRAFLPIWIVLIKYTSITVWKKLLGKLGGLPSSHLGKSKIKYFQPRTPSFKLPTGGCANRSPDWPDPPQGPPLGRALGCL